MSKMERIARKMGIERISKDQVSAMCRSLDAEVGELASREPGGIEAPYLFMDATYVKCRRDGRVQSTAVVTAIGVDSDGVCRILGLAAIGTQTHAGWLGFLRGLRARGLDNSAHLVVSGALTYPDFPAEHRRRIRANNMEERMCRKLKRRSLVVQVFPSAESMLRVMGAVCAERDEDWSSRRYISPESMLKLDEPAAPEPVESEASRRRGLMIVETAMELACGGRWAACCYDADEFGRRSVPERRATPTFPTLPSRRCREAHSMK